MPREICGEPTPKGPCTLKPGHALDYHRHRIYENITWVIENSDGVTLESGESRVPLNYAISRALSKDTLIVIHVKKWDDTREIEDA